MLSEKLLQKKIGLNKDLLHEMIGDQSGYQFEVAAFELISRHRLLPIAKEIVDFSGFHDRKKWENAISKNALRSMHYTKTLIYLLKEYRRHNIHTIPLKGPLLANILYGDIGKRQFVDLDLLLKRDELERTIQISRELGFKLLYPKDGLSEKNWDYYFIWKNDVVLFHEDEKIFVELHVGIFYHKLLPRQLEELFYKDLSKESFGGIPIEILNRNSTFLYLAFHGGFHQYFLLFWLRDFSEALQNWELDHGLILENAKKIGIERLLGLSLVLAEQYFEIKIPETYSSFLDEEAVIIQKLSGLCNERILGTRNLNLYGKIRRLQYNLNLRPGIKYRWFVIAGIFHHWYIRKYLGGQ